MKKKISKSTKAGVMFPVSKLKRKLKQHYLGPVSDNAAVYLAGALDFLVAETFAITYHCITQHHKKRIAPKHLSLAMNADHEFQLLLHTHQHTTIL